MKPSIEPIYHPYWLWEEVSFNMWGKVEDNKSMVLSVVEFMSDHRKFGQYMNSVVSSWKYSCEHNLSQTSQNRIAWLGQAACALALNCPEDIVRQGWRLLTDEQRNLANIEAGKNIKMWETMQCQKNQLELMF